MAFNSRNDRQFDEFFGRGDRRPHPRMDYDVRDDDLSSGRVTPSPEPRPRLRANEETGDASRSARQRGTSATVRERSSALNPQTPGSRSEAVRRRFDPSYDGSRIYQPEGRFNRKSRQSTEAPKADSRFSRRNSAKKESYDLDPDEPVRQSSFGLYPEDDYNYEDDYSFEYEGRGIKTVKKVLIYSLGILLTGVIAAVGLFLFRPADGGEHFVLNGSLPQVADIRQTQAHSRSAWLDWEPVDKVAGYRILQLNEITGQYDEVKTAYLSFAYITGLEPGSSGQYIIRPFCRSGSGEYTEPEATPFTVKTLPGDADIIRHQTATSSSITLDWQPVPGADGYEVERYLGTWSGYEPYGESSEAQHTVNGLDASCTYTFRMRPYVDIGTKRCYGGWSDKLETATSPETVRELAQGETTDSGYILSWTVASEYTGFELYRADAETGQATELIGQCGNMQYPITGLDSVNFSSYCVRAFLRHSSGISYGEFSDVFTAVTLPTKVAEIDQYTSADGTYTISWKPSERAEGYEIYAYSCHRNEYDLLAATDGSSYTVTDLSEYAERYRVRAYVSLGDLVFYGQYSDELPCHPYYHLSRKVTVDKTTTVMNTGASPDHELIKELPFGTSARVFGEKTGGDGSRWFRVELSDGTTGWISREDVTITNTCKTLSTREYTKDEPIIIYLSPSRQDTNFFWSGLTTEKEQMEAIGAVTHRILSEEYECVVYTATPALELRERAFEALELNADVYFAIHSNATGNNDVHYGASSYYCGASALSKKLGEAVNRKLNAIAPMRCTLNKQMYSALDSFGGVGYAEVRDPFNLGMFPLLAETDFHDNELTGQWIIDNHEAIGRAYAEALAETFDIPKKQ